jgi:hypothetical protein
MGALNDKMTALADKIREKHIVYPYKMNIDKMIELVDELHLWQQYFEGSAQPGDVSAGHTFYSDSFDLQTGTMPDTAASVEKNIVTVPAGRIREEQTLTVSPGSVSIDGNKVTVVEGYVTNTTLTVSPGSVSIDGNTVTVAEGYVQNDTLTVPAGNVAISDDNSKVIVTEGYVQADEIDLPSAGFQLVKVTDYHPAREGFTAPSQVVVSGIGAIGSVEDDWYTDGSAANGTYVITEDTRYKKGYSRVYKQVDGKYYLAGYDSSADEWSDTGSQWFIGTSPTSYGWGALLYYEGENIPSGSAIWQNMDYGSAPVTTDITNEEVSSLTETTMVQSVTAFDPETAEWTEGDSVDISSYSITPQTNGIYFAQGGKLIGQHIDRELHIPEDGLVRRFKSVDGHFVDTVWGTEMFPSGDISYDELGYCGNSAAPMVVTTNSYLSCPNTLTIPDNMTMNVFFRSFSVYGNALIFGFGGAWTGNGYITGFLNSGFGFGSNWAYGLVDGNTYGKWRMFTLTIKKNPIGGNDSNYTCRFYCNGKFISEHNFSPGEWYTNDIGVFSRAAIGGSSGEYISGQIDEACIWDRILTAEEIADMAKGLEGFNWDVPVKPYEQKQPVCYAPFNTDSHIIPTGQYARMEGSGGTQELTPYIRNGALWSYGNVDGEIRYDEPKVIGGAPYGLFTSGDYTVCVDVFLEKFWDEEHCRNYNSQHSILSGGGTTGAIFLYSPKGQSGQLKTYLKYGGDINNGTITDGVIERNKWTTVIARSVEGTVGLYLNSIFVGTSTRESEFKYYRLPFGDYYGNYDIATDQPGNYAFAYAIRNIRIYNRAITDEEIAELSGIEKEEE